MEKVENKNNDPNVEENPTVVYTLDLSNHNLQRVPKSIRKYKFCKSINLSCNYITSIKKDDFSFCSQLKELKLYGNTLERVETINGLLKLEKLDLQFNNMSSIGNVLKNCKGLIFLRLDSNKLYTIKPAEICMLNNLSYIDISSNKLDDIGCVNVLTSLETLHCTHNMLTRLPNLCSLKKLKEVDFSYNHITNVGGLKSCNRLQVINLNCNKIINLIPVGTLKGLEDLKICNNFISDLCHLSEQFVSLEVLEISGNKINSFAQVEYLLNLSSTLRELSLCDNPILIDDDMKLAVYKLLQNLQLDVLDRNYIQGDKCGKRTPGLMRPMSAIGIISDASINDQINFSEMKLAEFEGKIKSQFEDLKDSLMELPKSKQPSSILNQHNLLQNSVLHQYSDNSDMDKTTTYKCNSRARLNDAKAFAAKYIMSNTP